MARAAGGRGRGPRARGARAGARPSALEQERERPLARLARGAGEGAGTAHRFGAVSDHAICLAVARPSAPRWSAASRRTSASPSPSAPRQASPASRVAGCSRRSWRSATSRTRGAGSCATIAARRWGARSPGPASASARGHQIEDEPPELARVRHGAPRRADGAVLHHGAAPGHMAKHELPRRVIEDLRHEPRVSLHADSQRRTRGSPTLRSSPPNAFASEASSPWRLMPSSRRAFPPYTRHTVNEPAFPRLSSCASIRVCRRTP